MGFLCFLCHSIWKSGVRTLQILARFWVLESLPKEEWWAVFYTPTEAKRFAREAGFKGIKLYPLGCFTRGLQNPSLVAFLQENRDSLSRLQKEMAGIFRMDSAVHIFMTAEKS